MYYEEKMIDGRLCYRTDPDFCPISIEDLSHGYIALEKRARELEEHKGVVANILSERQDAKDKRRE